jgi:imidazolonepropionase-like amidohydrolase
MRRILKWIMVFAGMAVAGMAFILAIGLMLPLDPIPQFGNRPEKIVISDVTVIDVALGIAVPNRTVRIAKGRIVSIAGSADLADDHSAMVIDGRGKYLIPGLWDAHVHTLALSDRLHFPLMLAQGITSIRNMGDGCSWGTDMGCIPDRYQWQASSRAPNISATASYHIEELENPDDATALVKALKARGDDFIKIQLDDESDPDAKKFAAIVTASKENHIEVTGHVPKSARLNEQVYDSLSSIEHDTLLLPHCTSGGLKQCDLVLATLARRGTAYVPTHVASSGQDVALSQVQTGQDELLSYTSSAVAAIWKAYRLLHRTAADQDDIAALKLVHRDALKLTLKAYRAGVPILAGTDALDPFVLHGVALHEELEYLVRAGLSPAEALRAATASPAKALGTKGGNGQIDVGQRADLVLLTHDPLVNVAATRSIELVIAEGVVYGPQDRAAMQIFVKQQANSLAVTARSWWALLR